MLSYGMRYKIIPRGKEECCLCGTITCREDSRLLITDRFSAYVCSPCYQELKSLLGDEDE
jgi:hypothetical protein